MQTLLGGALVALVIGLVVGRKFERTRRAFKDLGVGRKAVPTLRKGAWKELRATALGAILVVFLLAAIFVAAAKQGEN